VGGSTGLAVDVAAWSVIGIGMWDVVGGERFVGGVGVGVFADDVPSVNETWEETQAAKREVNHSISTADSTFDPYCQGWEQDRQQGEEGISAAHEGDLPRLSLVKA